ncbi:MAG: hypothetical protein ACI4MT_04185 [Christensenellales bacterium]
MTYIYYYNKVFDNVYLALGLVFFIFFVINFLIAKWYLERSSFAFIWLFIPIALFGAGFALSEWFALIVLSAETLIEFMILIYFYFLRDDYNPKMLFGKRHKDGEKNNRLN